MSAYLAALAGAGAAVAVGLTTVARAWPVPSGRHRAPRGLAGVVTQQFRHCPPCGVETAAVVHADGSHTCTEGHTSGVGGTQ